MTQTPQSGWSEVTSTSTVPINPHPDGLDRPTTGDHVDTFNWPHSPFSGRLIQYATPDITMEGDNASYPPVTSLASTSGVTTEDRSSWYETTSSGSWVTASSCANLSTVNATDHSASFSGLQKEAIEEIISPTMHEDLLDLPLKSILERATINEYQRRRAAEMLAKIAELERALTASKSYQSDMQSKYANSDWLLQHCINFIDASSGAQAALRAQLDKQEKQIRLNSLELENKALYIQDLKSKQQRSDSSYVDDVFGWSTRLASSERERRVLEDRINGLMEIIRNTGIALQKLVLDLNNLQDAYTRLNTITACQANCMV